MAERRLTGWLPAGTAPLGLGFVINGIATYLFLALPARTGRLSVADYADLTTLWFAAYLIGPGLFVPLEQELARRVAGRPGRGDAAARSAGLLALAATGVTALLIATLTAPLSAGLFDGQVGLVPILAASVAGAASLQWAKGLVAGRHRFPAYAGLVALEGLARAGGAVLLIVAGVTGVLAYGSLVALAPLLAVAVLALAGPVRLHRPGREPLGPVARAIALLVVAQTAAQFLMNATPLLLRVLGATDAETGRLAASLLVARVPLFLFQALQASLLPGLAALAAAGDRHGLVERLRRVLAGLAVLGAAAVVGGVVLGPWATGVVFGARYTPAPAEFGALTTAAGLIILTLVVGQGLVVLQHHRMVAAAWTAGAVAMLVIAAVLPAGVVDRALVAGVVGPAVALLIGSVSVRRALADDLVAEPVAG